jgi:small GTP-binding protein
MREEGDFKVVVLGTCSVGKSSIIYRYSNKDFIDGALATVGAGVCELKVNHGKREYQLMLWDTAGEERFRSVTPSLLRGASGAILVYDLQRRESFTGLDEFLKMFLDTCAEGQGGELPVLLLGNKLDLGEIAVSEEMVREWMSVNQIGLHFQVSAKTGQNIEEAFEAFIGLLLQPRSADRPVRLEIDGRTPNGTCC